MTDQVVLVPGLWMPGVAMTLLAARLRRLGYAVHVFLYSGRKPHDANVERLARFVRESADGRAAHFAPGVATVKMMDGAGHWVHHDQLDAFMALLKDFL